MTNLKKSKYHLTKKDYKKLKALLGRKPNRLEKVLALALWNEHCSYRSSKIHLKKFQFPTKKKIAGLGEQAGVVDLGQGERICFKMESHNHPSYIIPYHGAETAVGGILRDIFAMNARPMALADYLCFGSSDEESSASRIDGVIRGIGDYGNCMGIPTITGRTEFSSSYNKNIVVNAMALGYLGSKDKIMSSQAKGLGNYVVYAGSRTGRDGILGADMASRSFGDDHSLSKPTVQVGDPFFGKQLMEACLLAMRKNLIVACQDMGAAGLTCSSFEMADRGELGLSLHLDKTPLRDNSLQPEDILLSESQERMLFICKPACFEELKKIFEAHQLSICVLGEVLRGRDIELFWKGRQILKINPKLFTSHAPVEDRPYVFPEPVKRALPKKVSPPAKQIKKILLDVLSHPQGRSRKFIYRQYDQRVGTQTLKDSSYPIAVLKLPESGRELGIAMGCRPYLMSLDAEQGAKDAVFYPALQLAVRGFEPLAVTDCLNFGNPEKKHIMGEFVLSVERIAQACKTLDTPIVSGNVSFYNESQGKNIPPTPAIAMLGLKENNKSLPPSGFQKAGESVYLLHAHQFYFEGAVADSHPYIFKPGSQEARTSHDKKNFNTPSHLTPSAYGGLQDPLACCFIKQMLELSQKDLFSSLRLVGKFGILYSLARMVLERGIGFRLKKSFPYSVWQERLYEVIVSCPKEKEEIFKTEVENLALDCILMGETQSEKKLTLQGESVSCKEMKDEYLKSWKDLGL